VVGACAVATLVWLAACTILWANQEGLLFVPDRLASDSAIATEPDVIERTVTVPGAQLSVLELQLPDPDGVVFFLHGNAGSLRSWFVNTQFYRRANYDLVMMDYRGFGKSTGRIESEQQLHADVEAVWRNVAPRYRDRKVVIYGRSLGSGLAAHLAAEVQPDLTVLVSPYVSILALARQSFPWVPAVFIKYPLRTDLWLPRIHKPILLLHGDADQVLAPANSRLLQKVAPEAKLVIVPGAGHADIHEFESYRSALLRAFRDLVPDHK
jgi:pimeloyl-ACP methyl ester carboxylesterase